jgi:TolB protein
MATSGGQPEWVNTGMRYNISPAISPDGRYVAFVARIENAFRLHLMDLSTRAVSALSDTAADESPSFSPNGRLILYATQQQGRDVLMTTTLDGRIRAALLGQNGAIRDPQWGPFGP